MEGWDVKVLGCHSFRATLVTLKRGVRVMDDDELMRLFRFFWEKKSFAWDVLESGRDIGFFDHKAVKYEQRIGVLLNICWDELAKRGISQIMDVE